MLREIIPNTKAIEFDDDNGVIILWQNRCTGRLSWLHPSWEKVGLVTYGSEEKLFQFIPQTAFDANMLDAIMWFWHDHQPNLFLDSNVQDDVKENTT